MQQTTEPFSLLRFLTSPEAFPRARFLFLVWSLAITLAGISVLSSTNPFLLLIPMYSYPEVKTSLRDWKEMYAVLDTKKHPVKIRRLVLLSGDPSKDVRKLGFLLSEPLSPQEGIDIAAKGNMIHLPMFSFAIKSSWLRPLSSGANVLLIDFRSETLKDELVAYYKTRPETDNDGSNRLLHGFFEAFAMTLFENYSDVAEIRFLIDGSTSQEPIAGFPLELPITRDILNQTNTN